MLLQKKEQKLDLWSELILYVNSITFPFVVIGDFNEISSHLDNLGRAEFNIDRTCILNKLLS